MADREQFFVNCFEDSEVFKRLRAETERYSVSQPFVESVINRLESAAKICRKHLGICSRPQKTCKNELTEAASNLRILFLSWCRKLQDLRFRNTPSCTHLAFYLLNPPDRIKNPGPGRPKSQRDRRIYTIIHFRALGPDISQWKDMDLLLVLRWTLWRRVRELGIAEKTGFTSIDNPYMFIMQFHSFLDN